MIGAGFEVAQGGPAFQNALLLLGITIALYAGSLLMILVASALDGVHRVARALYFHRRRIAWRLVWLAALPLLAPLAVATPPLLRVLSASRHQAAVVTRWAGARRRSLRPLLGRTS